MEITVKPYLFIRDMLGNSEFTVKLSPGSTVETLIGMLKNDYGLKDQLNLKHGTLQLFQESKLSGLIILVEGQNIKMLQGLSTVLEPGAVVALFPPTAGG